MTAHVALVDYGSGNLRSAAKAFERSAKEAGVDADILVTDNPDVVASADRIVLPGVGAFADCRQGLFGVDGMVDALKEAVISKARPFFGICVGMQLMATWGREFGDHAGLDWIKGDVTALEPKDPSLKIPHMGWNTLDIISNDHPVLANLPHAWHAYFVHSYHFSPADQGQLLAQTTYGGPVTAIIGRDNLIGTQFHPEKSQALGLAMIRNFLEWSP